MNVVDLTFDDDLVAFDKLLETPPSPPLSFIDDPIAMAWSAYRSRTGRYMGDIQEAVVTDEDRAQAQQIRNHYHRRITFQLLTNAGHPVSEFQRKLMGIVAGTREITKDDLGILHRIPFFYVEDCDVDSIIETAPKHEFDFQMFANRTDQFELIRKIQVERRSRGATHFWLRASSTPSLCKIAVLKDNPLSDLLESVLSQPVVKLTAHWHPRERTSNYQKYFHYQLSSVKLSTGAHFE